MIFSERKAGNPLLLILPHHRYSDFTYDVIEILTSYLNFEIQKPLKASVEFGNHLDERHVHKIKGRRLKCLSLK